MESVFAFSGLSVMPIWALMLVLPQWRVSKRLLASPLVLVAPALLYAALVLPRLAEVLPKVMRPELHTIAALLGQPAGATIAWAHFLAFDLFVGRWIYVDATERKISVWVLRPVLFLTLMVGPLGLLSYLAVREARARNVWQGWKSFLAKARMGSPMLVYVALGAGLLMVLSLAMQAVDTRLVTGAPAWAKPAKFGASVFLTGLSLACIFSQMKPLSRGMRRAANIFSAMLVAELVLITFQAARAVPSHFNLSTTSNALIFQTMGASITVFWITQVWLTVKSFRYTFVDSTIGAGIRLGLLISSLGGGLGFVMTARPTVAQEQAMQTGQVSMVGAHTVGAEDGGPGLPVTRWSTIAGDLRVPHFIGLHALQLLPFFAWAMSRRRQRAGIVNVVGASFGGLVLVTLIQALRGMPLFAADSLTVALVTFLVAFLAIGIWVVARRGDKARSLAKHVFLPQASNGL